MCIYSSTGARRETAVVEVDCLLVAEKPSVARSFAALLHASSAARRLGGAQYYLTEFSGRRWAIIGLRGHLYTMDFPEQYNKWRSIDPKQLFYIKPITKVEKGCFILYKLLREFGRYAEEVYLALDGDSEGESIAFEVLNTVKQVNPYAEFKRLWFSDTLPETLKRTLQNPRQPNPLLADKCFARMEIDLTIGAAFTRFLTLAVEHRAPRAIPFGKFLSYGPCQTPVLYLVVQQALKREQFKPEKFYRVVAVLRINGQIYEAEHVEERFTEREKAERVAERARQALHGIVESFKERDSIKSPPTPLNTVELQSRASRYLNMRSKTALDVAEALYQAGLISYPRTETEIYPKDLNIRSLLQSLARNSSYSAYAQKLLSKPFLMPTRGTRDDKAHPPIHPVRSENEYQVRRRFGWLGWKLYDFVVRHFLATMSDKALLKRQQLIVQIGGEQFKVSGVRIVQPGYLEIYKYEIPQEKALPILKRGDLVEVLKIEVREGETEPPPYLSEAELLKLMDRLGIGTDATAAQHIQTNVERGYFYIENKRCIPTPLGKALIKALESVKPELVRPEVRAFIEREISDIPKGIRTRQEVVEDAKRIFLTYYDEVQGKEDMIAEALIPTLKESYKLAAEKAPKRRRRIYRF